MLGDLSQCRSLDWPLSPLEVLARWPADVPVVFLHSGRFHERWARWSMVAAPTAVYQFTTPAANPAHTWPPPGRSRWLATDTRVAAPRFVHQPWRDLRSLLAMDGAWVGCLGYDLGRWIERLPASARTDRDWPIIELACCPGAALYDHAQRRWLAWGDWARDPARIPPLAGQPAAWTAPRLLAPPTSVFSPRQYENAVQRVIDYIAAGDVFQVNLAQRFTAELAGCLPLDTRSLFHRLAQTSPAWYGAYLELPGGRALASTSPELFLQVQDAHVITRPIKGTRPASVSADELERSPKDIAELNMIVDLLRNDLGKVCDYGSVRVTCPRRIESHPTVHHGVATIEGRLHASKDLVSLLRATLPGGSITGAPKVRAMQIIDQLEPVRRGPYCGTIGVLTGRTLRLNVAIRTLLIETLAATPRDEDKQKQDRLPTSVADADRGRLRVDFSVGGGVVADSHPAAERRETLDKAAALLAALNVTASQNIPTPS